ncbi:heat shock 70 kDa protein 12B-like [Mizuhopecten yessoensis]|uniref:heat shock 70 kDa protein 12B-like n=1 Tax=Mizuhopecten yessoensis TaxID=6573 RepID=UPI000B45989B|nr:heat shock 70 kDa protein 12B-like [Mizuhopecten yessoensis]
MKAGIDKDKLMLALEPEAAALYCRYLPGEEAKDIRNDFHGGRYMVVDMGGGTVDIAVHEVSGDEKNLTEILPASGGAWGGDNVNQGFINFFGKKIGGEVISDRIKEERTSHWLKLERNFEATKRFSFRDIKRDMRLDIPPVIITEGNLNIDLKESFKMVIPNEDVISFFDSAKHTISHMTRIIEKIPDIELILLVGGYVQSEHVSNLIRSEFRLKKVLVPTKAELAVLEGAVLYGFEPLTVSAGMCRHTYGIDCYATFEEGVHREEYRKDIDGEDSCMNIFSKVATEGDILQVEEKRVEAFYSTHKDENRRNVRVNFPFYASTDKSCQYTTDISCERIGNIAVEPPADGWPEEVHYRVEMYFGRTELEVKVFNDADETEEHTGKFDFLIEKEIPDVLPVSLVPPAQAQDRTKETKNNCTLC